MLIVVAHGSRNPDWREAVERQINLLQKEIGPDGIRLAYMELSSPSLNEVVSEAVQRGVRRFRVLPLFLAAEGHVERNIKPQVYQIQETFEAVDIELLPPMGQHHLFRDMLISMVRETD